MILLICMTVADHFIKHCTQMLEVNFGHLSNGIINKIKSRKTLNDSSSISDFNEFIDMIELNISVLSGKSKAVEICNALRTKAIEITAKQKVSEIPVREDIDKEINTFLAKNSLLNESDLADYAKYIALKYRGKTKKVEKEMIEKVKLHIKNSINRKTINEEIDKFLTRYTLPEQRDIDDFINYIRLLKLNFHEDELREQIEKERLFRKFRSPQILVETCDEIDLTDFIKTNNDKKDFNKAMQKQEISYILKEDSGVSDELLEFVKLATPSERDVKDTLKGLGLKHMIKKK